MVTCKECNVKFHRKTKILSEKYKEFCITCVNTVIKQQKPMLRCSCGCTVFRAIGTCYYSFTHLVDANDEFIDELHGEPFDTFDIGYYECDKCGEEIEPYEDPEPKPEKIDLPENTYVHTDLLKQMMKDSMENALSKSIIKYICTCNKHDAINHGCTCGAMEAKRKAKNNV